MLEINENTKLTDIVNLSGNPDVNKIKECLNKCTFEGESVEVVVVKTSTEALEHIEELVEHYKDDEESLEVLKKSSECVWNFYDLILHAFSNNKNHIQFENPESCLKALKAGLGFLICLGPLVIGVCMPETYIDEDGHPHREDGPAVIWGDDQVYFQHGVEINS